jgi:D-alanyl-D-alanine carboxypeptidase
LSGIVEIVSVVDHQACRTTRTIMTSLHTSRWFVVFIAICCVASFLAPAGAQAGAKTAVTNALRTKKRPASRPHDLKSARQNSGCLPCAAEAARGRKQSRGKKAVAANLPCHSKDYLDPRIRKNYQAALIDMKRARLKPKTTSYWRSSADQARLHRCSLSQRCRLNHPGLYRAMPPGQSIHEAGFAVDIDGVAAGPRGGKRLTPQGRRIVAIMKKHGFNWRYGLNDPVHFEANPQRYGYRSVKQAIKRNQTVCEMNRALAKKRGTTRSRTTLRAQATPPSRSVGPVKRLRIETVSTRARRRVAKSRA